MDGIGGRQLVAVVGLACLGGELVLVERIHLLEGADDGVAMGPGLITWDRLKQAATHNLKAFVWTGRAPLRCNALQHIAQALQRFLTIRAPYFVGALWHGDQQQGIGHLLGGFSERLREGDLRVVGAGRQVVFADKIAGVGHPLVDQHQAGSALPEEFSDIPGTGGDAFAVAVGHDGVTRWATQLVSQLTPEGVHHSAVGLGGGFRCTECRSHQNGSVGFGDALDAHLGAHLFEAGEEVERGT